VKEMKNKSNDVSPRRFNASTLEREQIIKSYHLPDFGFSDQLSFDLRGEKVCSNYKQNVLDHHFMQPNLTKKFFSKNSGSGFL